MTESDGQDSLGPGGAGPDRRAVRYAAREQYRGVVAERYDADRQDGVYRRWRWRAEIDALRKTVAGLGGSLRILDVPVGTGRMLDALQEQASVVVGADVSVDMLRLARDRSQPDSPVVPVVAGDALALPFPAKAFDIVVSIRFFQHLPESVVVEALREFTVIARRGVLVQVPLIQPLSPLVWMAARALHRLRHPLRAAPPPPRGRFFPTTTEELSRVAGLAGLSVESMSVVNSRVGQLRLVLLVPTARGPRRVDAHDYRSRAT
jgi:ubiquinone/menaquinone biosynthesis C-methylase UbiE